jgi:LmbE family N-acetylglucosaminyl deacetylase
MKIASAVSRAGVVLLALLGPAVAPAQAWRRAATGIGTTARVLIIGTHPEDEDNALVAWLSLGRHVETAYLSLTRGEAGSNVVGNERASSLGVVRTAELLAERERDGAHQYFTRAYDFGFTKLDSVVDAAWPRDSLLRDVVSVVRAFRPHVIISLFADSSDANATHRVVARLAREAFALSGDTARMSSGATQLLPAWTPLRLLTRVDSAGGQPGLIAVNVGEFDRSTGRTYAEIGAEIRRLQRTQPPVASPSFGRALSRVFRVETSRTEGHDSTLFGGVDTSLARLRDQLPPQARESLDTLAESLRAIRGRATTGDADSLAASLALIVARANRILGGVNCKSLDGVPVCAGAEDAGVSLGTISDRAARTLMDAANIVIEGTVDRDLVGAGDSVGVSVTVLNGSALPITVKQLSATSHTAAVSFVRTLPMLPRDSAPRAPIVLAPDSSMRWSGNVGVKMIDFHWWQFHGLIEKTWFHQVVTARFHPVIAQLISGEDRIPTSGVDATVTIAGTDVRLIKTPLVFRAPGTVRGDERHPLTGVPTVSLLTDRIAEYERAGIPVDRIYRVYVSSSQTETDTVTVYLTPPVGLKADSEKRVVVLPPLGAANVFFRLRGMLKPGRDSVNLVAKVLARVSTRAGGPTLTQVSQLQLGVVARDYPHIPSQQFHRAATERIEIVDLHVPTRLKIAYIKGTDDVQQPLGQLQINLHALEPSLLPIVDLSGFTTILIGAGAFEDGALTGAVPALRDFMRKGGTVLILPGGQEVANSGILPFPVVFDSIPARIADPNGDVHAVNAKSPLLTWPNVIAGDDFQGWNGERARGVPMGYDLRYRTVLSMNDPGQAPVASTILTAPVGKGLVIYTSLSLDRQLALVNPGAARLLVNLLSAGLDAGVLSAKK